MYPRLQLHVTEAANPCARGCNPHASRYDGLATIAAATLLSPEVFSLFFAPYTCPQTGTHIIGISKVRDRT